jgi:flagellar hook assembly protein FlgD
VTLTVHAVTGEAVATLVEGRQEAGSHTVSWNGRGRDGVPVATGVYFYRLVTEGGTLARKMLLLR